MLEGLALAPLVSALIALVGVLVGLGIARFVLPGTRKIKRLEAEIDQLRREHDDYRGRVNTHFHKTSELIGNMTASYKAVYDHLSDGAQVLCSGDALSGPALFSAPRLILAENVDVTPTGARSATAPAGAEPPAGSASSAAAVKAETVVVQAASGGAGEGVSDASDVATANVAVDEVGDDVSANEPKRGTATTTGGASD